MQFYPTLGMFFLISILCLYTGNISYTGIYISIVIISYTVVIFYILPHLIAFIHHVYRLKIRCFLYDFMWVWYEDCNYIAEKANNPHWQVKFFFLQCSLTSYPLRIKYNVRITENRNAVICSQLNIFHLFQGFLIFGL